MSFRSARGDLELLRGVGMSEQEVELLDHINGAVRDITTKIREGEVQVKISGCKELLQLVAAIRQDVLGDFPPALLTLNLELWELLIDSLSSCCCHSVSDSSKFLFPTFCESSSTDSLIGSRCCIILKEKTLELLIEMVQRVNELLIKNKVSFIQASEIELQIINLTEVVIPNLVCSSLKVSISSHCDCRLESLVSISHIIQEEISSYSEMLMKETRLWTVLFRLLISCNDLNSNVIGIKEKVSPKHDKNQVQVVDFSVNNLRFLDSAQRLCSIFTKFNFFSDNKGNKYFSLLATGDIFSQFVKYVSTIFKIVYFGNLEMSNSKLDFLLNQKFDIVLEPYVEYSDEMESSSKMADFNEIDGLENIEEIDNFDQALTHADFRYNYGPVFEKINDSEANPEQQKDDFETNSLMSCIVFLLGNEKIIEFDTFKILQKDSIRFNILDMLESLFKSSDLASLDSVNMISQTLCVYDFVSLIYPSILNSSLENLFESKLSYTKGLVEKFVKSPSHVVASIIFLLRSDTSEDSLRAHLGILLDSLFDLKNSLFENLIPITLGYLFDLLSQESFGSKNLISLMDMFTERVSDECLHAYSPLTWISKVLTLEVALNKNEKALSNASKTISSLRIFLSKWTQASESIILSPSIQSCQSRLRGIRRCILYCSLTLSGAQKNFEHDNLTDLYIVSVMLTSVIRNRSLRRTYTMELIEKLSRSGSFPGSELDLEIALNNLDFIERQWNLNTKHVFLDYFTLIDINGDQINTYEPHKFEETKSMNPGIRTGTIKSDQHPFGGDGPSWSVLKPPDAFHLSKLLSAIKNPRIQTQIKISALRTLTNSLTSSKIPCKIFHMYVDELVKILMQLSCKSFCTKKSGVSGSSPEEDSIFSISELISIEEDSLFYHLSIALNAIFISRSDRMDFLEYISASYSIMLIHHLSFWIFSSSGDCRCSSYSLLTTILIIILKTGVISDAPSIYFPDESELEKTTTHITVSPLVYSLLILPTSAVETMDYKEIYEEELHESSELTSLPKFNNTDKTNPFKPLVSHTTVSQGISKILWDLERLFRKKSIGANLPSLGEVLYSIFSLSFPWTRITSQAIHLGKGISKIKDSIESVISKLIMLLAQNNPEYLSEIERFSDLISAHSRNVDVKILAILKVVHSILSSFQLVNTEAFSESLSKYSTYLIVILSHFDSYLRDRGGGEDFIIGTVRPKVAFGIFDTISLCLDSCNGAFCDLLFDILPSHIQWSFIVLQVPKLVDPLNSVHTPTNILLVTKLLSRLPLKRWLEEDPRYTLECLKLLIFNKSFLCNRESSDLLLCPQNFQDSYFIKKVLSILEKISVFESSSHPINTFLEKNLLQWLVGVGIVSSSFEVQAKVWGLKLILLDRWDLEYSHNTYFAVSSFRVPENLESVEAGRKMSWGFIYSISIKRLNHLISNMSNLRSTDDNSVEPSICLRYTEYFEYLISLLRFLEASLGIHYKPIEEASGDLDRPGGDTQLVMTTFSESIELFAEEVVPLFLRLLTTKSSQIEGEGLLFTNLMLGFLCKLGRFSPLSSPVFGKIADNLSLLLAFLSRLSQVKLSICSFLQVQLILCVLKADPSCYKVLQEHLINILDNVSPEEISSEQTNKLLSCLLSVLKIGMDDQKIHPRLLERISLICSRVLSRIPETLPKAKGEPQLSLETVPSLDLECTSHLLMGTSLLSLKLSQAVLFEESSSCSSLELKKEVLGSVLAGVKISSMISVSPEFLAGSVPGSLEQITTLQESLTLLISSLSSFSCSDLVAIGEGTKSAEELFDSVSITWENLMYLISFYSKAQASYPGDLNDEFHALVGKKREFYTELGLCIECYVQIITMEVFTEITSGNITRFSPEKFTQDLKGVWEFINSKENGGHLSSYPVLYFSSFLYKVKVRSSGSSEFGVWNRMFNRSFYYIGFLDCLLQKCSESLVEIREICLGELRSCTIASLRALASQRISPHRLGESAFFLQTCSLFKLIKVLGLFLAEFEGPHNVLTSSKMKPLLSFSLESLALLSCVSKQLSAEVERRNPHGYEDCVRTWWKYTCKVTGESLDLEYFYHMITHIISLTLCCSSQVIPISETQMTNSIQGANPVPLSDLARSQSQGSVRFHDLFINLLDTESSVGLRLSRRPSRLPIEINEENGSLMSNVTQRELSKLDGMDTKINPKRGRLLLDGIILNDSVPVPVKCGVLKLFLSLALSSSKKKFIKHWKADELQEEPKIVQILEKAKTSRSSEFLALSLALLELLLSFNPNQVVSPADPGRKPRAYSDSQSSTIMTSLELLKVEASTFEDLDPGSRMHPIVQDLFSKCFTLLKSASRDH